MKFAHILAKLTQEPLFLLPEKARTIIGLVEARANGAPFGAISRMPVDGNAAAAVSEPGVIHYLDDEDLHGPVEPPPLYAMAAPGVAVIAVEGVIGKRLSSMETLCGGCDLDQVSRALTAALTDSNVNTILLDFNTPGGLGIGLQEISNLIEQVRESKPVIGFTDYACCSAGYWLAAACDEIFCTPSARVGSIGAYLAAVDCSKAWEKAGYERLIFNGDAAYKAMGTEGKEWTPEEKALMQERSVKATSQIRAAAQANRVLDPADMQGQTFDGEEALAKNLVDGLVNSREELLRMLAS